MVFDQYKASGQPIPTICGLNTIIMGYIFENFKDNFPQLENIIFIPLTSNLLNHAWQGYYNPKINRLAQLCVTTDDVDGQFNSGPKKLEWEKNTLDPPDILLNGYCNYMRGRNSINHNPEKAREYLMAAAQETTDWLLSFSWMPLRCSTCGLRLIA